MVAARRQPTKQLTVWLSASEVSGAQLVAEQLPAAQVGSLKKYILQTIDRTSVNLDESSAMMDSAMWLWEAVPSSKSRLVYVVEHLQKRVKWHSFNQGTTITLQCMLLYL